MRRMKSLLMVLLVILTVACGREDVTSNAKIIKEVEERYNNGVVLVYEKEQKEPFTGIYVIEFENDEGVKYTASEISYKDGIINGFWKNYDEKNVLVEEKEYRNGKANGKAKEYYSNGKIYSEVTMKDDCRSGKYLVYNEKGKVTIEYNYNDEGLLNGRSKSYDNNGNIILDVTYKNDVISDGPFIQSNGEYVMYYGEIKSGLFHGYYNESDGEKWINIFDVNGGEYPDQIVGSNKLLYRNRISIKDKNKLYDKSTYKVENRVRDVGNKGNARVGDIVVSWTRDDSKEPDFDDTNLTFSWSAHEAGMAPISPDLRPQGLSKADWKEIYEMDWTIEAFVTHGGDLEINFIAWPWPDNRDIFVKIFQIYVMSGADPYYKTYIPDFKGKQLYHKEVKTNAAGKAFMKEHEKRIIEIMRRTAGNTGLEFNYRWAK